MPRSWKRSRELLEIARESLVGGVSSPFRAKAPVPLYFTDGCGARLRDVDGNEYIDYVLAWGPMILGYSHPRLVETMREQAAKPFTYGAQHELEISVSRKIQQLVPCAERVAFTSSGSEAVQLAMRLARGYTGRELVLKFEGHYHGWMDSALLSYHPSTEQAGPENAPHVVTGSKGQVSNASANVIAAPWNRPGALGQIMAAHAGRIAAVIMEPVLCNSGCLMPLPGYLDAVRDLCRRHGALLIFDEIITGFRLAPGGAQAHFRVTPDLATFGKAVAGGAALSVVAGKKQILDQMFGGGVVFGGTFNGNPLSLAAAGATLTELARDNGAALTDANRRGERLMEGIRALARERGRALRITGFGTAFALHFTGREALQTYRDTLEDDPQALSTFLLRALEEGLHLVPDGRLYTSAAHTDHDIDETLAALARAL